MPHRMGWRLALCLAAPFPVAAAPGNAVPPGQPPADARVEHDLRRYRERLGLSDDQTDRVRTILLESLKKQDEARREADAKIREMLTAEQRVKFDEMQRPREGEGRPGGPPPFAGGGRPPGGEKHHGGFVDRRVIGPSIDELQRELNLSAEQRDEIAKLLQASMEAVTARIEESQKKGFKGADWQRIRSDFEKQFKETAEKIKVVLDPEQQKKFADLLEKERGRAADEGPSHRPGSPWGSPGGTPEDRVARALEALKIDKADQAAAVKALLSRVAKLQIDFAQAERAARDRARDALRAEGGATDGRLGELRRERQALEDQLRRAQEELRQGRTARQELELLQQGFLQ